MNELSTILWHLVICLAIQVKVKAKMMPSFVEPIANTSVATGRNTMLECTVDNLQDYKVAWLKMDNNLEPTLLTIHTQSLQPDNRFRVSHNNYRQWYLHISNVQTSDKGLYMCQINTEPMIKQTGYLDVLVPPSIVESDTSSDTIVDERQKLSLRCRASGYPTPTVTWRREDGKDINQGLYGGKKYSAPKLDGEYLNITQVTRDDMGAYLCIAGNNVPPSVSKRIVVQVNFRPKIKVQNQLVGAAIDSDVQLECKCEASPKPLTSWIRSEGPERSEMILLSSDKYDVSEEHDSYRTRMILKINQLDYRDFGTYKCVAKNTIGEKEGLLRLYEIPGPTIPTRHHKYESEQNHHKLHNNGHDSMVTSGMNLSASTSLLMDRNSHNKHDINNSGNNRASRAQKTNNRHREMNDGHSLAIKPNQTILSLVSSLLISLSIIYITLCSGI